MVKTENPPTTENFCTRFAILPDLQYPLREPVEVGVTLYPYSFFPAGRRRYLAFMRAKLTHLLNKDLPYLLSQ
jgi:hypothetical protein